MRETEGEPTTLAVEATPSLDTIFEILANRRRRHVLYYLYEQPDGVATLEELSGVVESIEAETQTDANDDDERRERIKTELHHAHLPKLEDAGVIEHDRRSETVRYWTQPSLEEWLEHAHHKERS